MASSSTSGQASGGQASGGGASRDLAPLTGPMLIITAVALALGTFMQVLDTTIANVAVPTIVGDLGASSSQGAWIITSFAVANGISVPLTGWLMMRIGLVKTFVGAVLLFTLASFLCGIAWDLPSLIAFRVLQGAVSGPMIPLSQSLLLMIFPPEKRATGLGLWSITTLVAPICGPIIGGYLSDNVHWSWIFLINLPVGIACAVVCWNNLKTRETVTRKVPVDTTGFVLLVIWVGAMQVMLDTGKDAGWFSSPAIVVEALIAIVVFVIWVIWEITAEHPIVDLSLFRNKNFAISVSVFCVTYGLFFVTAFLTPLWLQTQMGYLATWAGLVMAPAGVVAVILTPLAARLSSKVDVRWMATSAILIFGVSCYMRSLYGPDANFWELAIPSIIAGGGYATFFMALVSMCLNGIPQSQVPQATGLTNFARITAGSFAASLVTTLWDDRATLHQTRIAETAGRSTDPLWHDTLTQLQAHGASAAQAAGILARQAVHQAYFLATMDVFWLAAMFTFASIPFIWMTKRTMLGGGASSNAGH